MIIRCKDILKLLSDLYDDELEDFFEELLYGHIKECGRCSALLNTFEKTLDLYHSLEPIKLEREQKQKFHKWLRVEIRKIVIKRY